MALAHIESNTEGVYIVYTPAHPFTMSKQNVRVPDVHDARHKAKLAGNVCTRCPAQLAKKSPQHVINRLQVIHCFITSTSTVGYNEHK